MLPRTVQHGNINNKYSCLDILFQFHDIVCHYSVCSIFYIKKSIGVISGDRGSQSMGVNFCQYNTVGMNYAATHKLTIPKKEAHRTAGK